MDLVQTMGCQAFGRSFHNQSLAAVVDHLFADTEELIGLRCCQIQAGILDFFAIVIAHRADVAALDEMSDDRTDDPSDRRLAVCTGDADRVHLFGRIIIESVAEGYIGIDRIFHFQIQDIVVCFYNIIGINNRYRSVFDGLFNELVSVIDLAFHRKKDRISAGFA